MTLSELLAKIGLSGGHQIDDETGDILPPDDDFADPPTPAPQKLKMATGTLKPSPEMVKLQEQLAATQKSLADAEDARKADARKALTDGFASKAEAFGEAHRDRLSAAQVKNVKLLYGQFARDDHDHPVEGLSRTEVLAAVVKEIPLHGRTQQKVAVNGDHTPDPATTVLNSAFEGSGMTELDIEKAAREQNARVLGGMGIRPIAAN